MFAELCTLFCWRKSVTPESWVAVFFFFLVDFWMTKSWSDCNCRPTSAIKLGCMACCLLYQHWVLQQNPQGPHPPHPHSPLPVWLWLNLCCKQQKASHVKNCQATFTGNSKLTWKAAGYKQQSPNCKLLPNISHQPHKQKCVSCFVTNSWKVT